MNNFWQKLPLTNLVSLNHYLWFARNKRDIYIPHLHLVEQLLQVKHIRELLEMFSQLQFLPTVLKSREISLLDAFRDRYLRMIKPNSSLHLIMFVEVVNMTNNTQFKTLLNTWLNQKKPMITPSTHASFTLIA